MGDKIEVFICYAREDGTWLKELENKLSTMERQGLINISHNLKISAGSELESEINKFLKAAHLILLLVSSDFIASEQCYRIAERALEKYQRKEARVIPILLHESDWEYSIFGKLIPLPSNGRPISSWPDRNAAFLDVIKGIRKIVEELSSTASQSSTPQSTKSGNSSPQREPLMPHAPKPQGKQEFDVFLCHNNKDKPEVKRIGELLKAEGIVPWLDDWELRPGLPWQRALEQQIEHIKSAAVFVGIDGIGPWQNMEMRAFLNQFVRRNCPVIPVLLNDAPKEPALPLFLQEMTWVDFRRSDPDPMERLVWGITGTNPNAGGPPASGSQNIPGQASASASTSPAVPIGLTPRRRRDLEKRRDMLLEEQNMRNERLKATRKAWTIEMNPGIKFQLGAQIKDDEEALAGLETELDKIEQELQ